MHIIQYISCIYQGIVEIKRNIMYHAFLTIDSKNDIRLSSLETLQLRSKVLHGHSHPIHGEPAFARFSVPRERPRFKCWYMLIYLVLGPLMNDDVVNISEDEKIHYEDSNNEKNRTWEQIGFATLHTCHESHVIILNSGMFLPMISFWYI